MKTEYQIRQIEKELDTILIKENLTESEKNRIRELKHQMREDFLNKPHSFPSVVWRQREILLLNKNLK